MTKPVGLYTTFDGESVRGRFRKGDGLMISGESVRLASWRFRIASWHRPVVVVLKDWQDFDREPFARSVDLTLAEWCRSELGSSFGGVIFASDAIYAAVSAVSCTPIPQVRIVYELENHIHVLTVAESKPVSLIRFAAIEAEKGWGSIIARSDRWLERKGIAIPGNTVFAGTFQSAITGSGHLFAELSGAMIASAGVERVAKESYAIGSPRGFHGIRTIRAAGLVGSVLVLAAMIGAGVVLTSLNHHYRSTLERVFDPAILTEQEQRWCDSIRGEADRRIKADSLASSQVRWSDLLNELAELAKGRVSIDQFGSRVTESGVEIAFTGEGDSHYRVTEFVALLKKNESPVQAVQLVQFDRSDRKGYRFRVQCLVK